MPGCAADHFYLLTLFLLSYFLLDCLSWLSYCQMHQGMQEERRKESHTQGGYYLSVADCIYFGGMEASCFWLSSCVLVLGYKFRSTRTKEKYGGI